MLAGILQRPDLQALSSHHQTIETDPQKEKRMFVDPGYTREGRPRSLSKRSLLLTVSLTLMFAVVLLFNPTIASADVVLDWNAAMLATLTGQSPFAQARFAAITHLAVFEAVNAITRDYKPYLGTIIAPQGASAEAAAVLHIVSSSTTSREQRRVSTRLERLHSLQYEMGRLS